MMSLGSFCQWQKWPYDQTATEIFGITVIKKARRTVCRKSYKNSNQQRPRAFALLKILKAHYNYYKCNAL